MTGTAWPVRALSWEGGTLRILDQTALPRAEEYLTAGTAEEVGQAIRVLAVRGAPLLGIAAGFGMALAAARSQARDPSALLIELDRAGRLLVASRPTAVNIAWAVERVLRAVRAGSAGGGGPGERVERMRGTALEEALSIAEEDRISCQAIGQVGKALVPERANILTHCNTGALATGGWGTAQGVILAAHQAGKAVHVWVDETRPLGQGARLTAWELGRWGVPMTLLADTAAGSVMARGRIDLVIVGADRIAANGDVANKVGTYQLAVLARENRLPFYVAAPVSTVDPATATGADIPIEERDPAEVTAPFGRALAPPGTPAFNPAFDVTPARLVTAFVTDRGVARPPFGPSLKRLAGREGHRPRLQEVPS